MRVRGVEALPQARGKIAGRKVRITGVTPEVCKTWYVQMKNSGGGGK